MTVSGPASRAHRESEGFLRAYAEHKLPVEVLRRAKAGFPTSATVFMAPPVRARIRERVLSRPFLDLTGFAADRVSELLAACESGHGGFAKGWSLYMLSLWFHEWV